MKAVVLNPDRSSRPLEWTDWLDPLATPGWVTVDVVAAGLNRNDSMNIAERASRASKSVIGSDGAGIVAEVGSGDAGWQVGDEVVILPSLWWGDREDRPGEDFEILGDTTAGTLAEQVTVPVDNIFRRPQRLDWAQAAALPLAGLTAWRALVTQGGLTSGHRLLVTGASGGVATFAIQIANAIGAEVFVTTSTTDKLGDAVNLGASGGIVRDAGWGSALRDLGPFDVALDSAGADWPELIQTLAPAGTLVSIGRTRKEYAEIPIHRLFIGQHRIVGSTMGSPREFTALLDHVAAHSWVPMIDSTFRFADADQAFDRLHHNERVGKVVLGTST